jgi:predicted nucleotidyltransferase
VQTRRKIGKSVLNEIIRRIVDVAKPEKIILFGSAARGEMRPDSDIDLLVIKTMRLMRESLPKRSYEPDRCPKSR